MLAIIDVASAALTGSPVILSSSTFGCFFLSASSSSLTCLASCHRMLPYVARGAVAHASEGGCSWGASIALPQSLLRGSCRLFRCIDMLDSSPGPPNPTSCSHIIRRDSPSLMPTSRTLDSSWLRASVVLAFILTLLPSSLVCTSICSPSLSDEADTVVLLPIGIFFHVLICLLRAATFPWRDLSSIRSNLTFSSLSCRSYSVSGTPPASSSSAIALSSSVTSPSR
mmetsp:Transcript_15909/g.36748  ORF Transcript_15909/g.36748 Transcript_15909/m.36748 type:complete len:226 (+) Transcript_15909:791-1468(+)